jgi:hypothetical protein
VSQMHSSILTRLKGQLRRDPESENEEGAIMVEEWLCES